VVKRRALRERDEAAGREQAERRIEELLGKVREREAAARTRSDQPSAEAASDQESDPTTRGDAEPE
jgi:hypothetical protein